MTDGPPLVDAVEASPHTGSNGAEVVSSPEDSAPSEGGTYGQPVASTVEGKYHVTKRRSAPALIQGRTSPAKSSLSDATLLDSSRQSSPVTPKTPIRLVDADDDDVIKTSFFSQQDLTSGVWGTLCKVEKEKARYHGLVGQLQADLATERDHAQRDRGVAQHALGEAQDDLADVEAEVSELKDQLETEKQNFEKEEARYQELVGQLQADLATGRDDSQHDRGVARQALDEARDDIEDLEAEVSELKDQLETEKENSEDHLSAYHRCDRDAGAIIAECHERISEFEAKLGYENRKARHNFSKAEEFMVLARYWQDAFHQLGHSPEDLWKMLVQELRVRGFVFDYSGHLHRVGLRRAVLSAEDVEEVAGLGDQFDLNDAVSAGEATPNNQCHGVSQGSADLVVVEQEDSSLPEIEDETTNNNNNTISNHDLANISNIAESMDLVSTEDGNVSTDADRLPMQSVKHCKVRAVNRSSAAPWGTPSSLQNPRNPSFGSRHVLVPLVKTTALEASQGIGHEIEL